MTIKVTDAEITFEVSDFEAASVDDAYERIANLSELIEDLVDKANYLGLQVQDSNSVFACDPPAKESDPVVIKRERKNILESLNLFGEKND